jgi:hypothetical protein
MSRVLGFSDVVAPGAEDLISATGMPAIRSFIYAAILSEMAEEGFPTLPDAERLSVFMDVGDTEHLVILEMEARAAGGRAIQVDCTAAELVPRDRVQVDVPE